MFVINITNKHEKIRFFLTSTTHRNYDLLINSISRLKMEKYNFEIIIIGRNKQFNSNLIPSYLKDVFIFKHNVSFYELYINVEKSDFIIIPLDPKRKNDNQYKCNKVSGSIQLVYGFLKPPIIHREFSYFYNLNDNNSLIYNNNNLYSIIRKAILLNNEVYINLQKNLSKIS